MKLPLFLGLSLLALNSLVLAEPRTVTLSPDGSGDFKTLQEAIDSAPDKSTDALTIRLKPGTYKEWLKVGKNKPPIRIIGLGTKPEETVITYDLNANTVVAPATRPVGTTGSSSTTVQSVGFRAENVTFENSAGDKGQAVAIKIVGDKGVFKNCRFLGWQDTLYPSGGRQYFVDCYIEGRVDFIFGQSTAVFERCTIKSKNGGYITAANTAPDTQYGFVFLDCSLISDDNVPTWLGRPWQWDRERKAAVAYIRCKMGPHIRAAGWDPWGANNTNPENTTRYSEFGSTDLDGKPLDVSKRVAWSRQLTPDEAREYTTEKVLAGTDGWNPKAE